MKIGIYTIQDWEQTGPNSYIKYVTSLENDKNVNFSTITYPHSIEILCLQEPKKPEDTLRYIIFFSIMNPFYNSFSLMYPNSKSIFYRVDSFEEGMRLVDTFFDKFSKLKAFL